MKSFQFEALHIGKDNKNNYIGNVCVKDENDLVFNIPIPENEIKNFLGFIKKINVIENGEKKD